MSHRGREIGNPAIGIREKSRQMQSPTLSPPSPSPPSPSWRRASREPGSEEADAGVRAEHAECAGHGTLGRKAR